MANEPKSKTSLLGNSQIKERSTNFSKDETDRLESLIAKYGNVLMSKKTDGASVKQKEKAWSCIASQFNAVGEIPRTVKQLKYKFENLKRMVKKLVFIFLIRRLALSAKKMYKTGGGRLTPLPPLPASEDSTNWLKSIMSQTIDGMEAIYDDDVIAPEFIEETSANIDTVDPAREVVVIADNQSCGEKTSEPPKEMFDTSTPYSSLKRPLSSPLKRMTKRRKLEGNNETREELNRKKIKVLDELKELECQKVQDNIVQQKELHEQQLRHNEEIHKLAVVKIQLEIEILKAKLNKKEC